jgi:hypothetical protein
MSNRRSSVLDFVFWHSKPIPCHGLPLQHFATTIIGHITLSRKPLDERSAPLRDLYLITHSTQNRQTFMPPAKFEPTIPESERPQTQSLECAATATVHSAYNGSKIALPVLMSHNTRVTAMVYCT